MNELIERLANQSGDCARVFGPDLERFAALVAECCADIADNTYEGMGHHGHQSARAIRETFPMPKVDNSVK